MTLTADYEVEADNGGSNPDLSGPPSDLGREEATRRAVSDLAKNVGDIIVEDW